ncbi:MAG: hypothetical protein IJG80_10410 [Selenomonadaceae bacterium]|nr:hypothetical protein [Selenomonadaceae bacterium]MBQ3434962.1 hypothetical protein [Selenomonadaceae bacterium]
MKKEVDLEKVESDITAALLEMASYRLIDETQPIVIKRQGKPVLEFTVRGLDEDEWAKCRRQNLVNRGLRTEEIKQARFNSQVIYEATINEDKERIWKNKDVWAKLNVASGIDLINQLLLPGEKNALVEIIGKLSKYEMDAEDLIRK